MGRPFKRNVWCRDYAMCLDRAVMTEQPFSCEGCKLENNLEGKYKAIDIFNHCLFVMALFFPRIYQAYKRYQMNPDGETRAGLETLIKKIQRAKDKGRLKDFVEG